MNNVNEAAIDPAEMREWLNAYKAQTGMSWTQLARKAGIPHGTLSPFATNHYNGNLERVAAEVFKFKQMIDATAERADGVPTEPGFFSTPTAERLRTLLILAQMGRITLGATGPGTGKTMMMREYQSSVSNVWTATMSPTEKTLSGMMSKVARAIGLITKGGWNRQVSEQIAERIIHRRGLLVIDEANHLDFDAIEQLRYWHDTTGVGICLLGNEELVQTIEHGPRRDAYARLNSRIAQRHIQQQPVPGDVVAFCDAWGIADPAMRDLLEKIALTPGAGGLRECRQIVEAGSMLALMDERPLSFGDLKEAQSTRATRVIRA